MTEGCGNLIEYVIARSIATWQSQPFHMRLLRPFRVRSDDVKTFIALVLMSATYKNEN